MNLRCKIYLIIFILIPIIGVAQDNTKTKDQLGFLVWGTGEPTYYAPGTIGSFTDGNLISLLNTSSEYNFEKDVFIVELKVNGKVVRHSFKDNVVMAKGQSAWLIVDPSGTDYAPSFTDKFLIEFSKLPKGKHKADVTFKVNDVISREGSLTFISDGKNSKYKLLIPKFADIKGSRDKANAEFQKEQDEQERKDEELDREREKANYFQITISNKNSGYTFYIIAIDQNTLSETIYEVLPQKTKSLDLYKSKSYQIKAYNQNESKENARNLRIVDQKSDKTIITVK